MLPQHQLSLSHLQEISSLFRQKKRQQLFLTYTDSTEKREKAGKDSLVQKNRDGDTILSIIM